MDAKEFIQLQFAAMRKQSETVLNAITNEQFNWSPPGTGNSISSTFLHMLSSEDRAFQAQIQGKPRLWETEQWGSKIGLEEGPLSGQNWEPAKVKNMTLLSLLGFEQSVAAATAAYLAQLTPHELDRKIIVNGNERRVAEVISGTVIHNSMHTGEIAAIKGMMGIKGLPR